MDINETSHCFNLIGEADPTIEGLDNLFNAYKVAVQGTAFDGPTYFSEVLKNTLERVKAQYNPIYNILLILTDGEIHDMQETKDLIV